MRIASIKVPNGCTEIYVDLEDNKIVVSYASNLRSNEVFCDETGEVEELPKLGDFAVLWNDANKRGAIVANVMYIGSEGFTANDNCYYRKAVKFRNYEQYLKIKGIYGEDEP